MQKALLSANSLRPDPLAHKEWSDRMVTERVLTDRNIVVHLYVVRTD
jgi:hypothetical protein